MRSCPNVSYPVLPSKRVAGMLLVAAGGGAAVSCMWLYTASASDLSLKLLVMGSLLLALLCAGQSWIQMPKGMLDWSQASWRLQNGEVTRCLEKAPVVVIDLQAGMLLRCYLEGRNGSQWLWLERQSAPQHWLDLRRAVYSSDHAVLGREGGGRSSGAI